MKNLSIIIPTYKRKDRLEKTISSILDSDSENIEFIFVDNNSKDGTEELIKNHQQDDKRIRYFKNQTNIGANRNIYRGYLESFSDWIMILTDDDYLKKGFLEEVLELIKKNKECGLIIPAKKDEELVYNQTTRVKSSEEAFKVAYGSSGVITGLMFNKKYLNSVKWKLDDSIYPQISLASQISLISDIIYMVPENKPIIGKWGDNIINLERPIDFGVIERINILTDNINKVKKETRNEILYSLTGTMLSWATIVAKDIYILNNVSGLLFIKSLFKNKHLKSSVIFYALIFKNLIIKNEIKLFDKLYFIYLILNNLLKSLLKINFYNSFYFGIKIYSS